MWGPHSSPHCPLARCQPLRERGQLISTDWRPLHAICAGPTLGGRRKHKATGPLGGAGRARVAPLPLTVCSVCLRHSRPSHYHGEHVYRTNRLKKASPGFERDKNRPLDLFSLILPPKSRQETVCSQLAGHQAQWCCNQEVTPSATRYHSLGVILSKVKC